jgi:D-alanyl-D-alanine carboxypeptidase/D-alanyl-D-alanine-endopeptidase (penicillin-binding protein 4)
MRRDSGPRLVAKSCPFQHIMNATQFRCPSVLAAFFFLHAIACIAAQPAPIIAPTSLAELRSRLTEQVSQPHLAAAALGVKVVSLDTGKTLFERDAHKLLKPASNAKLYTGALALDRLGPDFRIKTSLYSAGKATLGGVVEGDLIVFGRGDPSFSARFNGGDSAKALEPLAEALAKAGVKRIAGDLVGDESFFKGPPLGDSWTWDDLQEYYGAEVSALTVEDNTVDLVFKPATEPGQPCQVITKQATDYLKFINRTTTVTNGGPRRIHCYRPIGENTVFVHGTLPLGATNFTDAVAVHDPALWFVTLLKDALAKRGVTVAGKLRTVNWLEREVSPLDHSKLVELAAVESPPLSEVLGKMLKPSQNLHAQLLLLQVGAKFQKSEARNQTTEAAGLAELAGFLAEVGIPRAEVHLQEGSGLSRTALLMPNATVTLLQHMATHRHAEVFRSSLPIAGVDGTLRSRLKGTPAEKNALAKTGTLGFVNTISGYVTTAAKEHLAFSIMLNNYSSAEANHSGRAEVDALVAMLAGFSGRSTGD